MTNIDAAYLAKLLQAQMANGLHRKTKQEDAGGTGVTSRKSAPQTSLPSKAEDVGSVPAEVLTQIEALSSTDEQLHRKAFRVFLQATLAQQLGVADPGESSFGKLVDEVLGTMEADAELSGALLTAGRRLVQLASGR